MANRKIEKFLVIIIININNNPEAADILTDSIVHRKDEWLLVLWVYAIKRHA